MVSRTRLARRTGNVSLISFLLHSGKDWQSTMEYRAHLKPLRVRLFISKCIYMHASCSLPAGLVGGNTIHTYFEWSVFVSDSLSVCISHVTDCLFIYICLTLLFFFLCINRKGGLSRRKHGRRTSVKSWFMSVSVCTRSVCLSVCQGGLNHRHYSYISLAQ